MGLLNRIFSLTLVTVNVSGCSGLEAALQHEQIRGAAAVAVQEHRMLRDRCDIWEHKLRGMGWRAAFTAAAATSQGGTSGGLLQCVPAAAGLSEVECVPSVMHEGRVRILHSHGLTPL
eukprot:1739161-Pyramimonas_sp.AAC.1